MLALLHAVVSVVAVARGDARWSTLDEHSFRHAGFNWFPVLIMLAFMFVMCAKDKKDKMQSSPAAKSPAAGVKGTGGNAMYNTVDAARAAAAEAEPEPERYELLPEASQMGLEVRDGRKCMVYDTKGRMVDCRANPMMASGTAVEWNFKLQNHSMDVDAESSPRRPPVETASVDSPSSRKRDKDHASERTPKSGKSSRQGSRSPLPTQRSRSPQPSSPASGKSRSRSSRGGSRTPKKQRTEKRS